MDVGAVDVGLKEIEGKKVGTFPSFIVGDLVGDTVGRLVGKTVGISTVLGDKEGNSDGAAVLIDGALEGEDDGAVG